MNKRFVAVFLLIFLGGCFSYAPLTKTQNPVYKDITFDNPSVSIFIQGSSFLITDVDVKEFVQKKYGTFEKAFINYFPQYLKEYSSAATTYMSEYDNSLLTEDRIFTFQLEKRTIKIPKRGSTVEDKNGKIPDIILILTDIHLDWRGATFHQNYSTNASINIYGAMLLWDNKKGNIITYGGFNTFKNISFDGAIGEDDLDNCLRLLIQDVTYDSPIYNSKKVFTYEDLENMK